MGFFQNFWEKNPIIELSMSADIKERDVPFTQATEEASGKMLKLKDQGPEKNLKKKFVYRLM